MRIICEQAWELKACTQPKALPISEWEYEVINKYARNETNKDKYMNEWHDMIWFDKTSNTKARRQEEIIDMILTLTLNVSDYVRGTWIWILI